MLKNSAKAAQHWLPQSYLKFEQLRLRPALELLGRVPTIPAEGSGEPVQVVDLGAGTCNMAPAFQQRWPNANVTFVDTSASMLEQARKEHAANDALDASSFSYLQDSFETFSPSKPVDLVFSNAALHWVSSDLHQQLLPRLLSFLKPGGVLAFQIPDTRQQPSHTLIAAAAEQTGLADKVADVRWVTCERDPSFYYEILKRADPGVSLDMWATIYAQVLESENPVADFTSSTGLGPYLEQLGGRDAPDAKTFEAKYRELIAEAYPKQSDGKTVLNFKRFFLVATKSEA